MWLLWAISQAGEQANDGLHTRDWLVPAISGAAGAAGALGAQALGRRAQLSVEMLRGGREETLAERREWHELEGEKRAARGIAATLITDLEYRKETLDNADSSGEWWPPNLTMEIELPRAERVALAAWIGDPALGVIVAPFPLLITAGRWRAWAEAAGRLYERGQFQPTKDAIDIAIGALRSEIDGSLRPDPVAPSVGTETGG